MHSLYKVRTHTFLFLLVGFLSVSLSQAQVETAPGSSEDHDIFSATLFPSKTSSRGAALKLEDLEAFSKGAIKPFDFQHQYKKVFLGSDFFDAVTKEKVCDSLKAKMGKVKSHFIPVSDGLTFGQSHFSQIEELEGFYKFKNSKNLPSILPNVDVWIKIETYKHGKTTEKNCLVIRFLIPETENGKIVDKIYALRNDGVLVHLTEGNEPDFSIRKDFFEYCIFPLNDPTETTHLVGKDFNIMGSFACQKQCQNMKGLLFPISRHGTNSGCVFFRKMNNDMAPNF